MYEQRKNYAFSLVNDTSISSLTVNTFCFSCSLFSSWCGPCQQIAPIYKQMSDEFGNEEVVFLKVDVDECPDAAAKYSVKAMPTFVSSVFCLLLMLSCCCCCCTVFNSRFNRFFTHSIFDTFIYFFWGDLCTFLLTFIYFLTIELIPV
jgi:thiol-disulfide isomerase/thioredoxin